MDKNEFIRRAVGLPWVDRACSFEAMDCWGVVVMYFRHVHGIILTHDEGYRDGAISIAAGYDLQLSSGQWRPSTPSGDCIVFMSKRDGIPTHVGVVIDGTFALHAAGDVNHVGQVRLDRLRVLMRLYHDTEFYCYADNP